MSVPLLYTATGARARRREVIELPWGVMRQVIQFAEIAQTQRLGLHCGTCAQDLNATNGDLDPILKMSCGCREWWSTNPSVTQQ